ncbi:RadC family protein [Amphibiibacter pelophylacis]|uniref:DNA repair protein RadC n=1 Tax=Amphibiibacter pelophylacis TaxID=1799477 RepID=A0ACC6P287_9BURK
MIPSPPVGVKDLPPAMRPREKLLARGPQALADVELLALVLRTGTPGRNVFALAQDMLDCCGGFAGLMIARTELPALPGLGPARRAELSAWLEMTRRALAQSLHESPVFDAPQHAKDYVRLRLAQSPREVFAAFFLDNRHQLIRFEELFLGTLNQASVYPREVLRRALLLNAAAVIVAHNHPSGECEPSHADREITRRLHDTLASVEVRLLDHLVVTVHRVVSLAEKGWL